MYKTIACVLVLATIAYAANVQPTKRANTCTELHEEPNCLKKQVTCANHHDPRDSHKPCIQGCYCKQGYARNSQGKCVTLAQCHKPRANDVETEEKKVPEIVFDLPLQVTYTKGHVHVRW